MPTPDTLEKEPTTPTDELRNRREEESLCVREQYRKLQQWGWTSVGLLMLSLPAAMGVFGPLAPPRFIAWPLAVAACGDLAAMSIKRARVKAHRDEVRRLEFQLDLAHLKPSPDELRAEQLLHINEYTLRQYYDLTLSQAAWIFVVGIVCLAFGLVVVAGTIYVIAYKPGEPASILWPQQLAIAVVGGIGSILSTYVAATYLRMHAAATSNLVNLHSRLVGAHHLYFANVLASRLGESEQAGVLSAMALALVRGHAPPEATGVTTPEAA